MNSEKWCKEHDCFAFECKCPIPSLDNVPKIKPCAEKNRCIAYNTTGKKVCEVCTLHN